MSSLKHMFRLAMSDYWYERLLSACSVLGLTAVLAPLMVLLGVHHGLIGAMTEQLLRDPRTLEITPVGSGKYGPEFFKELASLPEVAFIVPQTRSIAATMMLRNNNASFPRQVITPLTATDANDPLLQRWGEPNAAWIDTDNSMPAAIPSETAISDTRKAAGVILSESTARKLNCVAGDFLEGRVDRVRQEKRESATVPVQVLTILPPEAQATDMMYVPLELLVAAEDYRDGMAVRFLRWPGDPAMKTQLPGKRDKARRQKALILHRCLPAIAIVSENNREYASFRLYARSLEAVAPLWRFFQSRNVEVYVRVAEIDTVRTLDRAFTLVFGLIAGTALCGFMASMASSALAGVRRKSRSLGIIRLLGFSRSALLLFPMIQAAVTGLLGSLLAGLLYLGVAFSIDRLFAASLPGEPEICSLPPCI